MYVCMPSIFMSEIRTKNNDNTSNMLYTCSICTNACAESDIKLMNVPPPAPKGSSNYSATYTYTQNIHV